jgi:hypothetical protein
MNSAELYSKTLQGYSSILSVLNVSLSSYCKEHKVNYRGLRTWMRENSLPVPKSKQSINGVLPVPLIAPVTILSPERSGTNPSCPSPGGMLKGVQITLPGGLHLSIREISAQDMTSLIEQLNPRQNICLR